MVNKRVAIGIGLFVFGVAVATIGGIETVVPESLAVPLLGLVVVLVGLFYAASAGEKTEPSPPAPEKPAELPVPGEEIETQLEVLDGNPFHPNEVDQWVETREELESRLRSVAVATLQDRYNLTAEAARRVLESGSWSDDPAAVAFFTETQVETGSVLGQLRRGAGDSRAFVQANRAIDELGAVERGNRLLSELSEDSQTDDSRVAGSGGDSR